MSSIDFHLLFIIFQFKTRIVSDLGDQEFDMTLKPLSRYPVLRNSHIHAMVGGGGVIILHKNGAVHQPQERYYSQR